MSFEQVRFTIVQLTDLDSETPTPNVAPTPPQPGGEIHETPDGSPIESNALATGEGEPTPSTQHRDSEESQVGGNIASGSPLEPKLGGENVEGGRVGATATGKEDTNPTVVVEVAEAKKQEEGSATSTSATHAIEMEENEKLTSNTTHNGGPGRSGRKDDVEMKAIEAGGKTDVTMGDVALGDVAMGDVMGDGNDNIDNHAVKPDTPAVTINVTKISDTSSTAHTNSVATHAATVTSQAATISSPTQAATAQVATSTAHTATISSHTATSSSQAVYHSGTRSSTVDSTSIDGGFGGLLGALIPPGASDVGCPQWLQNMLEYLCQSSTEPDWQALIAELIAHEKASPVTGVSCWLYRNSYSLIGFARKCRHSVVLLRYKLGSKNTRRTFL